MEKRKQTSERGKRYVGTPRRTSGKAEKAEEEDIVEEPCPYEE